MNHLKIKNKSPLKLLLTSLYFLTSCAIIPSSVKSKTPTIVTESPLMDGDKICVIGDGGTGQEEQYLVAQELEKQNCKLIVYVGDVIYERGIANAKDPLFENKFLRPYKNLLDKNIPFLMALGNHDYGGTPAAWLDIAEEYPKKIIFPYFYYAVRRGDVCFIALDTNIPQDLNQIKWANETTQKLKNEGCKLSIAFAHHPYWSVGLHGDATGDVQQFLNEVVIGKIDVYLAGHDHLLSDETSLNKTKLLISGGAGRGLYNIRKSRNGGFAKSTLGFLTIIIKSSQKSLNAEYHFIGVEKSTPSTVLHSGVIKGEKSL